MYFKCYMVMFQCTSQNFFQLSMTSLNIVTSINDVIKCLMLTYLVMTLQVSPELESNRVDYYH